MALIASTSLVVALLGAPPASADDAIAPVVVDVPATTRDQPRDAVVLGQSDAGVVYAREKNTDTIYHGALEGYLREPDGTETDLEYGYGPLVGNRQVRDIRKQSFGVLESRVLPSLDWVATTLPDPWQFVAYTADGLLLRTDPFDPSLPLGLAIEPWNGGPLKPMSGLPTGAYLSSVGASDANGVMLAIGTAGSAATSAFYVDSSDGVLRALGIPWSTTFALGETQLAWITQTAGSSVISTMARPAEGSPSTVTIRPLPSTVPSPQLLPVRTDVVVFRRTPNSTFRWTKSTVAPVVSVHADGSSSALLSWGHDVLADGRGHVLSVGGESPAAEAIVRVDPTTGTTSTVAPLDPVRSHVTQVAIDGTRVITLDDSGSTPTADVNAAPTGAVVRHDLSFSGGAGIVGAPITVATNAWQGSACATPSDAPCASIAADHGYVAWQKTTGNDIGYVDPVGTLGSAAGVNGSITAISNNWVLQDGDQILNLESGATTSYDLQYRADIDNDVAYLSGSLLPTVDPGDIILRDLNTGTSSVIDQSSSCDSVDQIHSAGSWLVFGCSRFATATTPYSYVTRIVDRSSATTPWEMPATSGYPPFWVGNGFVARMTSAGALEWMPLDAGSPDWKPLGSVAVASSTVAVSRGSTPTIAWVDTRGTAHAALLPISTTAAPVQPAGVSTPPSAPRLTAYGVDGGVHLDWNSVQSEKISGYIVRRVGTNGQTVLPAKAQGTTITGLTNGTTYTFSVVAQNAAGSSPSTTVTMTAINQSPRALTHLEAHLDPRTSLVRVTWQWSQTHDTAALTGYKVWVGYGERMLLPADATSATISYPTAIDGIGVYVTAIGAMGETNYSVAAVADDVIGPTVAVPVLPTATFDHKLAVTPSATDPSGVATFDARLRVARYGKKFGAWTYPTSWTAMPPGAAATRTINISGATYCVSVRSTDSLGNRSGWSTTGCTVTPIDNTKLSKSGSWTTLKSAKFLGGSAVRSRSNNARLMTKTKGKLLWVIAKTCPTCGRIGVSVGSNTGTYIINLTSRKTVYHALVIVPVPANRTLPITISPWDSKHSVTIDGFAVLAP